MTSGTAPFQGWWVEFVANVLRQLPRPGQIGQVEAEGWSSNQSSLKVLLLDVLGPSDKPSGFFAPVFEIVPCLRPGETGLDGDEMLDRTDEMGALGDHHLALILDRQEEIPEGWRNYNLVFPERKSESDGLVWYLAWENESWQMMARYVGNGWRTDDRLVRFLV